MKTTLNSRSIANPRRTTLAHLEKGALDKVSLSGGVTQDGADPAVEQAPPEVETPLTTANPNRTVVVDAPAA